MNSWNKSTPTQTNEPGNLKFGFIWLALIKAELDQGPAPHAHPNLSRQNKELPASLSKMLNLYALTYALTTKGNAQ